MCLQLHIYDGISPSGVDIQRLAAFLQEQIPALVLDVRGDFLGYWLKRYGEHDDTMFVIARKIAGARVQRPDRHDDDRDVLPGETNFEKRFLVKGNVKPVGMLYDGFALLRIYAEQIPRDEADMINCHIILTNQLFGTWDEDDLRFHARTSVYGFPSFLSTTGLVEAPAKPRDFYIGRQLGLVDPADESDPRYLVRRDPRIQEALKGYLLQALFYHLTGDPFCNDRECRLFNAHWQEELIHAQIRPKAGLCDRHKRLLKEIS